MQYVPIEQFGCLLYSKITIPLPSVSVLCYLVVSFGESSWKSDPYWQIFVDLWHTVADVSSVCCLTLQPSNNPTMFCHVSPNCYLKKRKIHDSDYWCVKNGLNRLNMCIMLLGHGVVRGHLH